MNKSKIISAATGLATIMSATAATADGVSVNGYLEGWFSSGDQITGTTNTMWSQSVYVAYSSTLDNGMGLSVGVTLTPGSHSQGFAVDTGMGTINTGSGYQVNSAADGMDGLPNNANVKFPSGMWMPGSYDDGDTGTGQGIKYTSPSISGWTVAASMGTNQCSTVITYNDTSDDSTTATTCSDDRVMSYAASGSLAGVSIAAGVVDTGTANDDSFVTLGYSIGGVGIGYGNWDSDVDDLTAYSVVTDVAGLTVGFRYDDVDAAAGTADNSMNTYSIGKDFGGLSLTLMYADQDLADNSRWDLVYAMGF
ncbi:porin [Pelagibacterales bacterium]|nr:porin [Pelagibacterales bacterium]